MKHRVTQADLRAQVFEIAGDRCEWPSPHRCPKPATELAHLHTRGAAPDLALDPRNAIAACEDHARITDGQPPPGPNGAIRYREAIIDLLGEAPGPGTAWKVAETLRIRVAEARRIAGWTLPDST